MAETLTTKDGKRHVLIPAAFGELPEIQLVRDYCGDELADRLAQMLDYESQKEETDLASYEADLDHLHRMMRDWVDELKHLSRLCDSRKFTKATLAAGILGVVAQINEEL